MLIDGFLRLGPGEYGEGDEFIGLSVPNIRKVAAKYKKVDMAEIETLLEHKIHEFRLCALIILTEKFKFADDQGRKEIYNFYLSHTKYINNWDLVDASAHKIVGAYLYDKSRKPLYGLVKSKDLWEAANFYDVHALLY